MDERLQERKWVMLPETLSGLTVNEKSDQWDRVYRQYGPALARYLRRFTCDPEAAAELVQETFIRAMRAHRHPAADPGLLAWLYRIATNLALDHLRRRRRFRFLPLREVSAITGARPTEVTDQVRRALQSIPPDQAAALVLRLHEGFSRAQVAELLGVSEAAVKTRLARGRLNFVAAYRRLERGLAR